ncbi:DUF2442 domain-containing protein [candidate division KSB1 bacterium]|nr:DUF2442 domain-containing protein [candidate division KSB1 bacterium]
MVDVTYIKAEKNHRLYITLSNGKSGYFDTSPYLNKGIFKELKDEDYFKKVRIIFGGIGWPHQQDFSADTIEQDMELTEERVM